MRPSTTVSRIPSGNHSGLEHMSSAEQGHESNRSDGSFISATDIFHELDGPTCANAIRVPSGDQARLGPSAKAAVVAAPTRCAGRGFTIALGEAAPKAI